MLDRILISGLLGLGLVLAGCGDKEGGKPTGECEVVEDCPGENLQCIENKCVQVDCLTSEECPFGSYCDIENYRCEEGCQEASDCLAGEDCDAVTGTCVDATCSDTQLDCQYGEYCDQGSGDCYPDSRAHCQTCDVLSTNPNQCPGGSCFFYIGNSCQNSTQCDPGYECENIPGYGKICHADYCFVNCNQAVEEPCPRGFDCVDGTGLGDFICSADCNWMITNGYL